MWLLCVVVPSCASLALQQFSVGTAEAAQQVRILSLNKCFQSDREVTGSSIWAAAPALLHWLSSEDHAHFYRSRRVLELGSGTGYLGIGLAKLGASEVMLTDLPQQCELIDRNLELNEFEARD